MDNQKETLSEIRDLFLDIHRNIQAVKKVIEKKKEKEKE